MAGPWPAVASAEAAITLPCGKRASGRAKEHRYTDLKRSSPLEWLTASAKATASLAGALRAKAEAGPYDCVARLPGFISPIRLLAAEAVISVESRFNRVSSRFALITNHVVVR